MRLGEKCLYTTHSVTIIIVDVDEFGRQPFTLHKYSVTR